MQIFDRVNSAFYSRGVRTYTDARTGPDKVLGKFYHKRDNQTLKTVVLARTKFSSPDKVKKRSYTTGLLWSVE